MTQTQYDKPTYRQYDDPREQWIEWKRQANAIGYDEAYRHARVSIDNRHSCHECFCCACVEYCSDWRNANV
jgi:hypothetical protein